MGGMSSKSFDAADETRTPDKTKVEVVRLSGATVARLTFQPGWRWSECVKPVAGTESCQARHVGALVSGVHPIEEAKSVYDRIGSGELKGVGFLPQSLVSTDGRQEVKRRRRADLPV